MGHSRGQGFALHTLLHRAGMLGLQRLQFFGVQNGPMPRDSFTMPASWKSRSVREITSRWDPDGWQWPRG